MSKQDWKDNLIALAWAYGGTMLVWFTGLPTWVKGWFE
jgi:hypothetical protein